MLKYPGIVALSFVAIFAIAGAPAASAQAKKMTYEQAWAKCKEQVNATVPRDADAQRQAAGGACMKKYGFRLKK